MRMNMFIDSISKIYLGIKVDSGLFHTAYFISCNNTFFKSETRHCNTLFKIHMIKLHTLWLFGGKNVNVEKHFPDVKKLPSWKTLIKQFL